jgi:hypothetical protein
MCRRFPLCYRRVTAPRSFVTEAAMRLGGGSGCLPPVTNLWGQVTVIA